MSPLQLPITKVITRVEEGAMSDTASISIADAATTVEAGVGLP